jgi:hypothetical protein
MIIAFDVDDTLIIPAIAIGNVVDAMKDVPNYDNIAIFRWFQQQGHNMIVWSGGGVDYAKMWAEKLGLFPCTIRVKEKNEHVDIAFDDCDVDLAKVNVKVKRMNNHISRRAWNNHQAS